MFFGGGGVDGWMGLERGEYIERSSGSTVLSGCYVNISMSIPIISIILTYIIFSLITIILMALTQYCTCAFDLAYPMLLYAYITGT